MHSVKASSKGGMVRLTLPTASARAQHGIRVNTIAPAGRGDA